MTWWFLWFAVARKTALGQEEPFCRSLGGGAFLIEWGWEERWKREEGETKVWKRKAPIAQVLLAALLYPTITQRALDHLWEVLVRTQIPQVLLWLDPKSRKSGVGVNGWGKYKDVPCFCCLGSFFKSGATVNPNVYNCHCRSLTLADPPPPTKHLCLAPSIVVPPPLKPLPPVVIKVVFIIWTNFGNSCSVSMLSCLA